MSCYNWESGTIKIPSKVFARFRKDFIIGYNEVQQRKLDTLKKWREIALRDGKGKRNYNFKARMLELTDSWADVDLVESLFSENRKPKAPTKKMFNFVNGKDNAFDVGNGDGTVGFNQTNKTVSWAVWENNHACESAHKTGEGKLLFRLLNSVTFTRGSGGVIVGNDEYNNDGEGEGGGANYAKITYGK